ncbi:MAG: tetratricopeptide repeat protein [Bacteroidales bacterium]|nr:tetratricopeptide repeat protein [Bacteroidales bacterium]
MRKKILFVLMISLILSSVSAQKSKDTTDKKGLSFKYKMLEAKSKFSNEDYYGAIRIYRELVEAKKNDPTLNYCLGECYFELKALDKAMEYFKTAEKINPNSEIKLFLKIGQIYQYAGNLDSAIIYYNKYSEKLVTEEQKKNNPANKFIKQCQYAKDMIAHPVNVKINNLGPNINSQYVDADPSLTADGKMIIFTSRRPDTKGGGIDFNTGQYYDDIYYSLWDDKTQNWKPAEGLEELNTPGFDSPLSISPDGKMIFLYKNILGVTKSGDIYYSKLSPSGKWTNPKPMTGKINSSYFESSACLSGDGNTFYFVSERKGGYGNADIYKCTKIANNVWSKPENLGPIINSSEDEIGVFIHPDGKTIYFCSKGHGSMGGYDIFRSVFESGKWSAPVNIGYPINSTKDEVRFILSTDGKKAYISSSREGGSGDFDLYEIDMTNYNVPLSEIANKSNVTKKIIEEPFLSIFKGTVKDSQTGEKIQNVVIEVFEEKTKEPITTITTNEFGEFFSVFPGNMNYEIIIVKKDYEKLTEKLFLPYDKEKDKPLILNKDYVLKKK